MLIIMLAREKGTFPGLETLIPRGEMDDLALAW
jgi:hypothetical protein